MYSMHLWKCEKKYFKGNVRSKTRKETPDSLVNNPLHLHACMVQNYITRDFLLCLKMEFLFHYQHNSWQTIVIMVSLWLITSLTMVYYCNLCITVSVAFNIGTLQVGNAFNFTRKYFPQQVRNVTECTPAVH